MNNSWVNHLTRLLFIVLFVPIVWMGWAGSVLEDDVPEFTSRRKSTPAVRRVESKPKAKPRSYFAEVDTTTQPIWPNEDDVNPTSESSGISVPLPDNIKYSVDYNPATGKYEIVQKIGDKIVYRPGTTMTLEEYMNFNMNQNVSKYWNEIKKNEEDAKKEFAPSFKVRSETFDDLFGGSTIEIRPQGSAELTFGINRSKTENPRIPVRQQSITTFNFDQRIQLNVVGNIGTKMKLNVNYNTESTFDFENQMKLEYTGDEDQIIRKIELGNVNLPLSGSLIQGSQSLFGAKIETQWGRLKNTTVLTQQKGERKNITVQGGAQTQNFNITCDSYEANRHYFLSTWFHDQYDQALAALPVVQSGANITRIEVWVVNQQANTQDVRNVIALSDLGEAPEYISGDLLQTTGSSLFNDHTTVSQFGNPNNSNNDLFFDVTNNSDIINFTNAITGINSLYPDMQNGVHFERVGNARKLNPSEFTFNSRLGFVSLKQALNNAEVLGVAYEYTLNGKTYQVGTISQDGYAAPQALVLKMLKSSITMVRLRDGSQAPLWKNMMKNVYNLGAFGIAPENFRLDVWYNNPATGVDMNFIPRQNLDGRLLIQVLNLDRIDQQQQPYPDGFFDFIPNANTQGGLIDATSGRIYFPTVEPFGRSLENKIREFVTDQNAANQIVSQVVFQPLYDSTRTAATVLFPQLNRFRIKGQYQSASGSEISLNALNIPQGSVNVTAGGIKLQEGVDYTVDYNLGRVRILNDGVLQSGQPINVSVESNSLFNMQFRTMLGSRFDYKFNDNLSMGATLLNLRERPITQKVNIGDEPVNNTVIGYDINFKKDSEFLTRLVDRIPLIDTKEKSSITFSGEAAKLFPGHSRAISRIGNAYLDDFEGSQSVIDLRSMTQWFLASVPKGQSDLFPESNFTDSLVTGMNRARTSWYMIDPLFFTDNPLNEATLDQRSDHRARQVLESEVFPKRQLPTGTPPNTSTLDVTFYPNVRGQYNYDVPGGTDFTAGLNPDGSLAAPETRWGGIQRALNTTDFEMSNVQFIQFWLMDPFNSDSENSTGGELYFNLGNVSEDVLNDSQWSYENGFPNENNPLPVDTSNWGLYPAPENFNVVNAFDNSVGNFVQQDIGLDGLNSQAEQSFFANWLAEIQGGLNPDAYAAIAQDPSADDYKFFRSSEADNNQWSILKRYEVFNGYEGNANTATPDGYPIAMTTNPNTEDINQDITLNTIESYFQYKVDLKPNVLGSNSVGRNYITDTFESTPKPMPNGETKSVRWYQFKIPIEEWEKRVGNIPDFRSIRFIRMYMKGFKEPVTLRFARIELVRGEWRPYLQSLAAPQVIEPDDDNGTSFNIAAVNIEENGSRDPVPYVIPPGIVREQDVASANLRSLNEQSLSYQVCNLNDGDARAAYRNVHFDMRQYKRVRMFAHVEALGNQADLKDNDLTVFVRLGSDFNENYYEYELPMKVTPWYTNDPDAIWPEENNFDILLRDLHQLKATRPTDWSVLREYSQMIGKARVSVRGNPNLQNVTVLLIGVRNPKQKDNPFGSGDDGRSKCAVVWVNELRLSDFDNKSGWAALANLNVKLADFATVAVAGNISTPGWGTLEQRVQQRQQETRLGFDANTTIQLGKFFPQNWGVQLPMYLGYSEQVATPRFSPLQPDIELDDIPNVSRPLRTKSQTYTKRRSINFNEVRITPKKGADKPGAVKPEDLAGAAAKGGGGGGGGNNKPRFYAIENFSVSYSYNELYFRDINMDWRLNKQYRGAFDYSFSNKPLELKPFSKVPVVKDSKYLKWLKEFNLYLGLKQIGFHTDMNRVYETSRVRNNTLELTGTFSEMLINTQVLKNWNWNRQYTLKYDLTKNLKADFTASNTALVLEPRGVIDRDNQDWYQAYRDSVWSNIRGLGESTNYNHATNFNYKVPLDKLPFIDFLSADARYGSTFAWQRAPFTQDSLGNTIQNSRTLQLNAQGNMETLYNKSAKLKEILSGKKKDKDNKKGKEDPTTKDGFGKDEKQKKEKAEPFNLGNEVLRFMMMVRNVQGSYTRNEGMMLPGYNRGVGFAGLDDNFDAPGYGFLLGQQNTDLRGRPTGQNFAINAATRGWLNQQPFLNNQYTETSSETWNYKINLEPIKYFKVEITANRQEGRNLTSFFRFVPDSNSFQFQSPLETGNFTASINSWGTAFVRDRPKDAWTSDNFEKFLDYRLAISQRLNQESYNLTSPRDNGYYQGYGPTSQNVVIPAFVAAYTGRQPGEVSLNPFRTKVQPNWRITYDGLTKINSVKKYFKQFNVTHQYRSTLSTSYVSNLNFRQDANGRPTATDASEDANFIAARQIQTVTIQESLSPLVGFDMTIKTKKSNDPQVKVELKRDRTVVLGLANYQITETKSNAIVIGFGYKITEVPNPFGRKKGSKLPIKLLKNTTINLRADFTIRDNVTIIRKIQEVQNQPTAGQRLYNIKFSADMAVSDKLTIRLFYDHQINQPKVSISFPTSNINAGIALRFTLNS